MQIVAAWSRIPIEKLSEDVASVLTTLPAHLNRRVIGQPAAVAAVTRALQRSRCGLRDVTRPIAALLFAGPTGVGKTCLATELATHMFGSPVRICAALSMRMGRIACHPCALRHNMCVARNNVTLAQWLQHMLRHAPSCNSPVMYARMAHALGSA